MATPSTEGSTKRYTSTNKKASVDFNNPFSVSIEERTTSNSLDGEDPPLTNECGFSFVQAFVVNYGRQQQEGAEERDPTNENERMVWIENMDKVFKMDYSDSATPARRIYEVKIEVGDDRNVKRAQLQKKPIAGEEGYRADPIIDTAGSGFVYIPVCETINENITKLWLRDNIHWGNIPKPCASSKSWVPVFYDANEGVGSPSWYIMYNLGTVNGRIPDDFNTAIPVTQASYDTLLYIYLDITISGNRPAEITYEASETPVEEFVDPVQDGSPPSRLRIMIGSTYQGSSCMLYDGDIKISPYIHFSEQKASITLGESPYTNWYKWRVE